MTRLWFIWKSQNCISHMDRIFDYWIQNASKDTWKYEGMLGDLLVEENDDVICQKQEAWIQRTIERHFADELRMYYLFESISGHGTTRRRNAIRCFLEHNADYALFEKPQTEPRTEFWSGSYIPVLQEKIDYLESLLPMLSGIDYLKHKQYVERRIESHRARVQQEEIRDMMNSLL